MYKEEKLRKKIIVIQKKKILINNNFLIKLEIIIKKFKKKESLFFKFISFINFLYNYLPISAQYHYPLWFTIEIIIALYRPLLAIFLTIQFLLH